MARKSMMRSKGKSRGKIKRKSVVKKTTRTVRSGMAKGTRGVRKGVNWTAGKTNRGLGKVEKKLAPNY